MNFIIGKFKADVAAWRQGIAHDREAHNKAGLHFQEVWRNVDDPDEIFFLFKVDELDRARKFLQEAGALDQEKSSRGEIPHLVFLESA